MAEDALFMINDELFSFSIVFRSGYSGIFMHIEDKLVINSLKSWIEWYTFHFLLVISEDSSILNTTSSFPVDLFVFCSHLFISIFNLKSSLISDTASDVDSFDSFILIYLNI